MDFLEELPQQIFEDILRRVPYKCQQKIKSLLKPAKGIMESFKFYQERINLGLAQNYICLLQYEAISIYDPVHKSCIMRTPIPANFQVEKESQIFGVKHKLVLVGVTEISNDTTSILIYDLLSCTWKEVDQIPTATDAFACCASPEGWIYVAGGYSNNNGLESPTRKAAVYKVDENKWELLPMMNRGIANCRGVFIEGTFYVIGVSDDRCQRFDPTTSLWTTMKNLYTSLDDDVLYAFGRLLGFRRNGIEEYDWDSNTWRELKRLPEELWRVHATVWYDQFFLCGYTKTSARPVSYLYKPETSISLDRTALLFLVGMDLSSVTTIEI